MTWLNLLKRKLNTLSQLSAMERSLLVQALLLLPIVALSLHLMGLRVTQQWLTKLPATLPLQVIDQAPVGQTVRMVRVAARYQPGWANCLKRSLVLWALLYRQGIVSDLKIGVQRATEAFAAHAWVEYDGRVLNDSPDVHLHYLPFQHSFEVKP